MHAFMLLKLNVFTYMYYFNSLSHLSHIYFENQNNYIYAYSFWKSSVLEKHFMVMRQCCKIGNVQVLYQKLKIRPIAFGRKLLYNESNVQNTAIYLELPQ